ncbi:GIY-YIG nuclease family protein [Luteibacter sp. SG786]|uniref:GIY-YIG nuclease family protein n=1 Tax=Luteibacter sp. SG786 TaxID=2587130 RepID=UPI00141ED1B1|nr:GIY-YIG nuclease family protein [Luteibacter sp. SG786]NII53419.1 putative endonuclease [Luteibacter sp. SG786]
MLASGRNGTLYIGVTSDLAKRVWQHKGKFVLGFSAEHAVDRLVWFEMHVTMESAILREKALKRWKRAWKIRLIEERNPYWNDLFEGLL